MHHSTTRPARFRALAPLFAALILAASASLPAPAQTVPVNIAAPVTSDVWWKHAVVYEIYPRSYQDSNGDGLGDLNGITQRLPYLQSLGVDAIWIAPMYPSPQVDFGYDISNYESVDPQYGTLADMDKLIAAGKQHNIRVVLDMVLNHTSDKHQWFIDSASSRTNPRHNWYVWNDGIPADGPGVTAYQKKYEHEDLNGKKVVPPNNWTSGFGGSAWEWVPAVHQYYYHFFYIQQPDLNWRNPEVEKAAFGAMRFWLDRGVAGFRLDAIPTLFEDPKLTNAPELGGLNKQGDPNLSDKYQSNLPEVHDVIRRMRAMVASYAGNRVLIGETYLPDTAALVPWYGGEKLNELQLPMNMLVGFHGDHDKLNAASFRTRIEEAENILPGSQPLFVFDNHDNVRSWERYGDGVHNEAIARTIAAVLYTSRATAMTWEGAEIGMVTTTPTRKEDVKDPIGITGWPNEKGRDGERTPMQWDTSKNAGFSTADKTWLPVPPNYKTINVATEEKEPDSLLNWNKKLIALRRSNRAMHDGGLTMLNPNDPSVLSWLRSTAPGQPAVVVAMNMSAEPKTISLDLSTTGFKGKTVKTLLTDQPSLANTSTVTNITLPPFASWIAQIQ
ncbi:alpha-glucosidase [Granulicella tundricola]|uniref:Alpha amylase catalytic region n=1 Tax=Granulicella tundricola (strain ATCC BAA-1859 / DSM 23138 / MP5ACTX9) TaxID=1198114 RepID=E8X6B5_GRATM|nr:alpha-glucosidase [Granulicella tundricola]ADW70999.1 alpha amylase catalytic region [Granulicella tundricola MP5ACTX9]